MGAGLTRLVLVEHAPDGFHAEPDDRVVALTAEACYDLDRRAVPCELTTDFGGDVRLAEVEPEHWRDQLRWIDCFDEVIAAHAPETREWRFGAATLYAYHLKTLMDPVRVCALELSPMLDSCDRALLLRRASGTVWSDVLALMARARGLAYEDRAFYAPGLAIGPTADSSPQSTASAGVLERLDARLRRAYRRVTGARRPQPTVAKRQLTLLFADYGYDLTYLLDRARERGHRCLRVLDEAVIEDGNPPAEVARLPIGGVDRPWAAAASEVASPDHPLWGWPNGWIPGVPLADVVRPRVVAWLERTMPRIAARAGALDELLRAEGVDFVVAANPAMPDVLAAAAVTSAPTQSALVDHGHRAHASVLFDLIMLRHVDHDFCATGELARYMESRRAVSEHPAARMHVGSYRWRADASPPRSGEPPAPVPEGRPVVVYALTATGGSARYLNGEWYSDGWYYHLCRRIVDVLASHPEVHSVVKLFPGDGVRNPIDLYVRDLGLDHVVSSRAPLRAWIPWASRIVFDYPSTGLYETAVAGVPYLALLYTGHRYRPEAEKELGRAAVQFTEPGEAAQAVDAFVAAPDVSAPRLTPEGDEILATLERLAKR